MSTIEIPQQTCEVAVGLFQFYRKGTETPRIAVTLSKLDSGRSRTEIQTEAA